MKFFIAIALIAAVASADLTKPTIVTSENAELQEIIAAINSPSTNPATAAALEAMLLDLIGVEHNPIAIGPAIVDFPLPDDGAVTEVESAPVTVPAPAVVADPSPSTPLVQIILNINQAQSAGPAPLPAAVADKPEPIQIVDVAPVEVVDVMPVVVDPVQVVDIAPVAIEPVLIGTPIIPAPAVVLPDELN